MPYRRLPNTDIARLKALKSALNAGLEIPPFKLAFSQSTLHKLRQFFPSFEQMLLQQRTSFSSQSAKSKELMIIARKAKLYVSHFYQVLNFAIMRGELSPLARKYFGLRENDSKIPTLNTEKDILYWGEKLIKGEAERIAAGGNPITNPTAAVVKVRYEQYVEAVRYQKVLQKTTNYATDRISSLRSEADNLILAAWNEVEATYDLLPDEVMREKAARYGVTYVYRPYEREKDLTLMNEPELQEEFVDESEIFTQSQLTDERQRVMETEEIEPEPQKEQLQYSISFLQN